jgi:hypothetical protein
MKKSRMSPFPPSAALCFLTFAAINDFMGYATYSTQPIPRAFWILTATEITMLIAGLFFFSFSLFVILLVRKNRGRDFIR